MRTRQKQRIIIGTLCAVIIGLAVGYAVLSSQLSISGTGGIASDFNILFTDIQEGNMNGATTVNKQITDSTTATFTIDLKSPGSNGEYLITVENRGNIDAYVESINGINEANSTEPTDIKFSIEDIKVNDKLKAKESKVFKVKVSWNSSSTSIPNTNKNLTLTINFAQDTGNSSGTDTPPSTTGEAVETLLSQYDTYNYMDGTYVKGFNKSGKDMFYEEMLSYGFDSIETINEKFFDDNEIFKADVFEEWGFSTLGITEEMLESAGVDTVFEALFGTSPDEFFSRKSLNNYIWFDGFLWRIMGKNADGSIRMITEEDVTTIPWGEENTAFDYDNSYVNDWLNNYFYPKLEHKDLLINQTWCSNTSYDTTTARTTCTKNLSSVQKTVGLLSLDEYNLASDPLSYLETSQDYVTLTPAGPSNIWQVWSDGRLNSIETYLFNGVRPVVNLSSSAIVTGGNGTITDPYIIGEVSDVTGNLKDNSHVGEYVTYAGRNYRVVETSASGTKLILDGYYDSNNDGMIEDSDKMAYDSNDNGGCTLCTTINEEPFVNWLSNNSEIDKSKLVSTTWYRGDYFDKGDNYKDSLESTSNPYEGRVGLIRIGEMLSGQSETMLTKITETYWVATPCLYPYTESEDAYWVAYNSGAASSSVLERKAVRPVIMISPNVQILGGNGTFNSPFRI